MKLAIVATHPILSQVPWYRELAACEELNLKVYYALLPSPEQEGVDFDLDVTWNVPLLDGYSWEVLRNTARSPSLSGFFGSRTPGVRACLARDLPDAVIINGWYRLPLLQTLWACNKLKIPIMVRGDSNWLSRRPWWKRAIHRSLLSRFDAFLAVGRSNYEFYQENGVPAERIFMSPHFVDVERFRRQAELLRPMRMQVRREWGISDSELCVLFVGKLIPKKRVMDLLRACKIARASGASVKPLLVGSGVMENEVQEFAREMELPVILAGFLNQVEISRAYVAADCLVLPSDYGETWGLVVNEAMIHDLPVVVSDRVGCGPDLVQEGATGHVFPFGSEKALALILERLAADPISRRRMGLRAGLHIQDYSPKRAAEGTLQALRFVLGMVSMATSKGA